MASEWKANDPFRNGRLRVRLLKPRFLRIRFDGRRASPRAHPLHAASRPRAFPQGGVHWSQGVEWDVGPVRAKRWSRV